MAYPALEPDLRPDGAVGTRGRRPGHDVEIAARGSAARSLRLPARPEGRGGAAFLVEPGATSIDPTPGDVEHYFEEIPPPEAVIRAWAEHTGPYGRHGTRLVPLARADADGESEFITYALEAGGDAPPSAAPGRFEADILAFEAADRRSPPAPGGVLFVGSSSIRMWETLSRDFPDLPVIRRGFGGSEMEDVLLYADRIVFPYRPAAIVLYEGDNDLNAGKPPEGIFDGYRTFAARVRERLPGTRLLFIAVKPSPARRRLMDEAVELNRLIRDFAASDTLRVFVDVFTPMLGKDGEPRGDLFLDDGLHLNAAGYALWRSALAPHLGAGAR